MKVIVALILAATSAVVYSENCGKADDCTNTTCTYSVIHCVDGLCNCSPGGDNCLTNDECRYKICCRYGSIPRCSFERCHCLHNL